MATVLKIPENPRILVADLAYIGDLLMSTPAITNLRKAFPSAVIDILVSSGTMPVIEHNPDINTVFTTDMKKRGLRGIREEARKISTMGYDIAISFHRAHGTLMMLRMSGISKRIGFTNGGRAFFLSSGVPFIIQKHRAWNHLRLLEKSFGIHVDYTTPTRLVPDSSAVETVRKRLESIKHKKGFIAVNPNAAWATKRWTPEGFADILYGIISESFTPILIGGPNEKQIAEEVKSSVTSDIADWTGETTLHELTALLAECVACVTNDSGPMHIAQAVGTPVIAIFGPTDPARCGPWEGSIKPIQIELDCIKCYRKTCWHHSCMRQVKADEVLNLLKCV